MPLNTTCQGRKLALGEYFDAQVRIGLPSPSQGSLPCYAVEPFADGQPAG